MGDRAQELQASCELIMQIAEANAGELLSDIAYSKSLVLGAYGLLEACEKAADTFHDLQLVFQIKKEPKWVYACQLAEQCIRDEIAKAGGGQPPPRLFKIMEGPSQ